MREKSIKLEKPEDYEPLIKGNSIAHEFGHVCWEDVKVHLERTENSDIEAIQKIYLKIWEQGRVSLHKEGKKNQIQELFCIV